MTFRLYLFVMTLGSVAAWSAWIVVLSAIDPSKTGALGFFLFYVTLAIALMGTISLAGAGIRAWLKPEEVQSRQTITAFRHSLLITALVLVILLLSGAGLLRWWSLLLSVVLASIVELIFLSSKHHA